MQDLDGLTSLLPVWWTVTLDRTIIVSNDSLACIVVEAGRTEADTNAGTAQTVFVSMTPHLSHTLKKEAAVSAVRYALFCRLWPPD